jgi:uncharacterized protein YaiL (DUF2058 family)
MNSLLKEQLLKAGFAAPKKADPPPADPPRQRRPAPPAERRPPRNQSAPPAAPSASSEPSLKDAFAQRERQEQSDRDRAKAAAEAESKRRKLQREQLKQLLAAAPALNDPAADIARNFNWARKIRRIYVTAEQLRGLNAGELGVVALDGRFTMHPAETVRAAAAIDPHALGLLVDPAAPEPEPEYNDPRYQVPDDLVW